VSQQVDLMMRLVAIAAYVTIGIVPYAGSGLVAPPWAVVLLWAIWLGGWVLLVRALRHSPKWAWAVSLASLAVWILVVAFGGAVLGWSA
jgi:hypothetical protein